MNRLFVLIILSLFVTAFLPSMVWAAGETAKTEKITWRNLIADVIGHYPIQSAEDRENKAGYKNRLNVPKNWQFDFGMQRFIMSHTSYQFGNPDAPLQKPISRLEFPLNTWWLDFRLRRTCPRWSIGGRAGLSVARNIDGRMEDSDWENPDDTTMLTTYSKSATRAEQNYLFRGDVDVNISDWLGLPSSFEIRPLFAFEFQRFKLMAHDGTQWSVGNYDDGHGGDLDGAMNAQSLPGNAIHFRQDYYMYLVGLRGSYEILKAGKYIALKTHGEADWGPVLGFNEDHHLLRSGQRFTYENTMGSALYFSAGLDMVIAKDITAGIIMDYLCIRTRGIHKMSNVGTVDQTWPDGVKVWSDQTSLIAHIAYAF